MGTPACGDGARIPRFACSSSLDPRSPGGLLSADRSWRLACERIRGGSRGGSVSRGILGLLIISVALALVSGCSRAPANRLQGYIEGEFVYVASPLAGTLEKLEVRRGAQVKKGDVLFVLESAAEKAAKEEAERRLAQGRSSLEDARKGRRPSEVESIEAQIKQAQAAFEFSESELARQEKLIRSPGVSTEQDLDRARSVRDQNRERLAQLRAELETARLGSRPDQVAAAEANVQALEAGLAKADWNLSQKRQFAPEAASVFDTLYREGE
jgi:HlyD family secretion protein